MPAGVPLPLALLAIAMGATLGAWARWGLGLWLNRQGAWLPWGTLLANLVGGLAIGMLLAWLARIPEASPLWRLGLITGFLGALTTFSTFSAESLSLLDQGQWGTAVAHAGLHLVGSIAAAAVGAMLVRQLA